MKVTSGSDGTSRNGYGDACADAVMYSIRNRIEKITGENLLPTFSFVRQYRKGDELTKHVDWGHNEISCNLSISKDVDWPVWFRDGQEDLALSLEPGDGIVYKGMELEHWREKYSGQGQTQMIVAYVIDGGEYHEQRFDGKGKPCYTPYSK